MPGGAYFLEPLIFFIVKIRPNPERFYGTRKIHKRTSLHLDTPAALIHAVYPKQSHRAYSNSGFLIYFIFCRFCGAFAFHYSSAGKPPFAFSRRNSAAEKQEFATINNDCVNRKIRHDTQYFFIKVAGNMISRFHLFFVLVTSPRTLPSSAIPQ